MFCGTFTVLISFPFQYSHLGSTTSVCPTVFPTAHLIIVPHSFSYQIYCLLMNDTCCFYSDIAITPTYWKFVSIHPFFFRLFAWGNPWPSWQGLYYLSSSTRLPLVKMWHVNCLFSRIVYSKAISGVHQILSPPACSPCFWHMPTL